MIESMGENGKGATDFVLSQADFYSSQNLNIARNKISKFYDSLKGNKKPDFEPFFYAMIAYGRIQENSPQKSPYISVIDFSKPNTTSRFFIINLETLTVENSLCVGHGKNSGNEEIPNEFSNKEGSLQSSLGAFKTSGKLQSNTKGTWKGLLLEGLENSDYRAKSRGIYIHPGGIDQSEGCFTIPYENSKEEVYNTIEKLEGGCLVYSYFNEESLKDSRIVNPTLKNILLMSNIGIHKIVHGVKGVVSNTMSTIKNVFNHKHTKNTENIILE